MILTPLSHGSPHQGTLGCSGKSRRCEFRCDSYLGFPWHVTFGELHHILGLTFVSKKWPGGLCCGKKDAETRVSATEAHASPPDSQILSDHEKRQTEEERAKYQQSNMASAIS